MSPAEIIARAICNGRKPMVVDGDAYENLCSWAVAGDMDAVDELAGFDRDAERALAALEAEGFVVVPVEPTIEMVVAGEEAVRAGSPTGYRAMLAARPR